MGVKLNEFLDLVHKRRSIRRFKPDAVPDEYIEKILEAARWAMSGANAQPWEFIVVKDPETRKKIVSVFHEYNTQMYVMEKVRVEEFRQPKYRHPPAQPGFKDAPVLIVVVGDRRTYMGTPQLDNYDVAEGGPWGCYIKNMGNATQILHLAVASAGLGSQWLSVDRVSEYSLLSILDVPVWLDIHTVVAIGYPAYKPLTPYRRGLEEIVHYEKYDRSRARTNEDILDYIRYLRKATTPTYMQAKPYEKIRPKSNRVRR